MITRSATHYVFEHRFAEHVNQPPGLVSTRWHRPEDIPIITTHHVGQAYVDRRLFRGARIAVAEIDGELAGWRFFQPGPVTQTPIFRLHFPSDAIGAFAAFVRPEFRGRRIYATILDFAAPLLAAEGYSRCVSMTRETNASSLRAHAVAGERTILTVKVLSLWRLAVVVEINGHRRVGLWSRRNRFDLRLD